jgi:superfamily II helicase
MGILDNLEAYLESAEQVEKCHYCQNKAKYEDIAEVDKTKYDVVGVCECHAYKGLVS